MGNTLRWYHARVLNGVAIIVAAAVGTVGSALNLAAQEAAPLTTITQDMRDREYAEIRGKLLAVAEVMPGALYEFRAVEEIRSFGEELNHTADVNFRLCGMASGQREPQRGGGRAPPTTKTEIVDRLRRSLELCDEILATVTDATAVERTVGRYIRASQITAMLGHSWHGYGKLTIMMRLNGIVPAPPPH